MLEYLKYLPLFCLISLTPQSAHADDQPAIDDRAVLNGFTNFISTALKNKSATDAKTLRSQLKRRKTSLTLPIQNKNPNFSYAKAIDSVAVLAAIYKCPNCARIHNSTSTAWAVTADGVMASNYHVFDNKDRQAFGIATRDGKFFAVTEILAANQSSDVALFRVKATTFPLIPLPLAFEDAPVSEPVNVISHPDGRFFTYTSGKVSRYYKKNSGNTSTTWMSITADYARGSSGGPVMDDFGSVIGMVANTNTIYYKSKSKSSKNPKDKSKDPVQMVIKNCVPAHALRALINTSP